LGKKSRRSRGERDGERKGTEGGEKVRRMGREQENGKVQEIKGKERTRGF